MPIKPGKPGTRVVTGKVRAQLQRLIAKSREINAYNNKLAERVPPVHFLDAGQAILLANVALMAQGLLDKRNT